MILMGTGINCSLAVSPAMLGRALTKTLLHSPLMLFEPSAIPLWYIWSYENKFSRPYMP